jgi:methionine sulfoxide reductase heme-binding subunit
MLSFWLKKHLVCLCLLLHIFCTLPALYLLWAYFFDQLGENPLEMLTHHTGRTALILLVLTLTITPLKKIFAEIAQWQHLHEDRRLTDWNWLIRLRRPLGLWSFFYGVFHAWIFLELDVAYDWRVFLTEVEEKPYLLLGVMALLLLVPLAVTSIPWLMRRMGKHWLALHRLVYLITLFGICHFWMLLKPGVWRAWPETVAIILLLSYRLWIFLSKLMRVSQKNNYKQRMPDVKKT